MICIIVCYNVDVKQNLDLCLQLSTMLKICLILHQSVPLNQTADFVQKRINGANMFHLSFFLICSAMSLCRLP